MPKNKNAIGKEEGTMRNRNWTLVKVLFLSFFLPAYSDGSSLSQQTQTKYYEKLSSPNIVERMKAVDYFSRLSRREIGEENAERFIDYFEEESNRIKAAQKNENIPFGAIPKSLFPEPESFLNYITNLCLLAGKSGNIRAIPILMEYQAPPEAYSEFGEEAVLPFIKNIGDPRQANNYLHYRVLGYWLEDKKLGYTTTGKIRKSLKDILIKGLALNNYSVCLFAIAALRRATDEDLIPIFDKIAKSDPWHLEESAKGPTDRIPAPGAKVLRYPLREIAKSWLEKRRR